METTQNYVLDQLDAEARAPVESDPENDAEAKILLAAYLGVPMTEFSFLIRPRNRKRSRDNTNRIEEEMKRSVRNGYVLTDDGRRVEPDHPDSPLRKAGMI